MGNLALPVPPSRHASHSLAKSSNLQQLYEHHCKRSYSVVTHELGMANKKQEIMFEEQTDRKVQVASTILERLDSGEPLSTVLSQIKRLAKMHNDNFTAYRVDLAIHGLLRIPEREKRILDPTFMQAALSHCDLCKIEDVRNMTMDKMLKDVWKDKAPVMDWIIVVSVLEIENRPPAPEPSPDMTKERLDLLLQLDKAYHESKLLLTRIRAYFYDYTSEKLLEALKEKDRIALLGPDYHLVLSSLGVLDTVVGDELEAALDRLRSPLAANWSLCALGCRNVVMKLGKLLWQAPGDIYHSELLGKELALSAEMEKNKLSAYIDRHCQQAKGEEHEMLAEAHQLVLKIWSVGSKGKSTNVRFTEAQALVVDTFHLVDLLDQTTGLVPIFDLN